MKFNGHRLKEAREAMGLSLRDLARQLDISFQTLSSYELGDTVPGYNTACDIAVALDRPLSFFAAQESKAYIHSEHDCAATAEPGAPISPGAMQQDSG